MTRPGSGARAHRLATLAVALLAPGALRGQPDTRAAVVNPAPAAHVERGALDSVAAEAARRTARYADRRVAVADGYRRLGADFPGMGEHWLHPGALLSGGVDPARPTLLMYAADAEGRPTLLGVGFVVTTRRASSAAHVPGWPEAWHEHSGLLADESGAGRGRARPSEGGTRVWVLHAWTALANPGGPYAPDNWALPFARVGLAAPAGVDADVGRAFSLAVGGDGYLRGVLTDAGLTGAAQAAPVDSVVARARARVAVLAARARAAGTVRPAEVAALRAEWQALAAALRVVLGPAVGPYLEPPHPQPGAADVHHSPHHAPHAP